MPATVVLTEPFQGLATSYAGTLGAAGYPFVVVPHPIATRDEEDLRGVVDEATPAVVRLLTRSTGSVANDEEP